jgi:hypothetical protein
LLTNEELFGIGRMSSYICVMTFRQLTNDLMLQGWRAYYVEDVESLTRGHKLNTLAIRNLIEIQVYEGKNILFVKTVHPPKTESNG